MNKEEKLIDTYEIEDYMFKRLRELGLNYDINTISKFANLAFDFLVYEDILEVVEEEEVC